MVMNQEEEMTPSISCNEEIKKMEITDELVDPSRIRIGICCIEKKMSSRPMTKILEWLSLSQEFEICRMNDDMILNKPIEEWL